MALRFRGSIEDQFRTANEAFVTDTPDILETQALEARFSQSIARFTGTIGIETHHREHCPRRHRSCIVIARNAVRQVTVIIVKNLMHSLLRPPLLAREMDLSVKLESHFCASIEIQQTGLV